MPDPGHDMPLPPAPRLAGRRVALRGFRRKDFTALFGLHSDPQVMRYWSFPAWTECAQARGYFARALNGNDPDTMLCWAITLPPSDLLVGTTTLFSIDRGQGRAEIGYALGSDRWGKGLAREAVALALDHAFDALGLRRVEADVDPRNAGSMRLLESLGFRQEGLLRERWHVGDEVTDSAWFGLLAREWRERRLTLNPLAP